MGTERTTGGRDGGASPESHLPLSPTVYHVLLALGEAARHGYGIIGAFEELTGGAETLLPGTLYATLSRMTESGMVEEVEGPSEESSGGPPRRYYRATPFGRAVARAESARLERLLTIARSQDLSPGRAG